MSGMFDTGIFDTSIFDHPIVNDGGSARLVAGVKRDYIADNGVLMQIVAGAGRSYIADNQRNAMTATRGPIQ